MYNTNNVVVQRGGVSGSSGSVISHFLRELCDSSAVKRPVTLIARQCWTTIGQRSSRYRDISSLRRAGEN